MWHIGWWRTCCHPNLYASAYGNKYTLSTDIYPHSDSYSNAARITLSNIQTNPKTILDTSAYNYAPSYLDSLAYTLTDGN
jgi:hypothetical protein